MNRKKGEKEYIDLAEDFLQKTKFGHCPEHGEFELPKKHQIAAMFFCYGQVRLTCPRCFTKHRDGGFPGEWGGPDGFRD